MIAITSIKNVVTIDSPGDYNEQTGYELDNVLEYEKPWLEWRSNDLTTQNFTLSYSGSIDSVVIFGANFSEIKLDGVEKTLGYHRIMGEYRGYFSVSMSTDIDIQVPGDSYQTIDDAHYKIWGIALGNKTTISSTPNWPITKELILPTSAVSLESGIPKKHAKGRKYHSIKFVRRGMDITDLNEFRDIKRAVGKTSSFVIVEDIGNTEDVYLVRRTDDFSYKKQGHHDYQDDLILEEIA